MRKLEELIEELNLKIVELEHKVEYLNERIELIDEEYETISYWTGRYVAQICDLINQNEI
jgi:uncharacterized protein YPO0396